MLIFTVLFLLETFILLFLIQTFIVFCQAQQRLPQQQNPLQTQQRPLAANPQNSQQPQLVTGVQNKTHRRARSDVTC